MPEQQETHDELPSRPYMQLCSAYGKCQNEARTGTMIGITGPQYQSKTESGLHCEIQTHLFESSQNPCEKKIYVTARNENVICAIACLYLEYLDHNWSADIDLATFPQNQGYASVIAKVIPDVVSKLTTHVCSDIWLFLDSYVRRLGGTEEYAARLQSLAKYLGTEHLDNNELKYAYYGTHIPFDQWTENNE